MGEVLVLRKPLAHNFKPQTLTLTGLSNSEVCTEGTAMGQLTYATVAPYKKPIQFVLSALRPRVLELGPDDIG